MFRTELTITPAAGQLPRTARVLTMGSCFADSIGKRLESHKVETRVNPFGTVFQPLALARLLRAAAGEEVDWQQHLVEARGRWQSYDLHGSIGADSPVELLQYIQEVVRQTSEFLHHADIVVLTLGTAWAYRLRETGELVSNCHKQPADLFVRELLTPDEIINALAETHAALRRFNPELRFVLTVSPVRHLKDTLPLNAVSKSVLRLATHIVSELLPGVAYFPAFELLTDDLRDYRFYAADMLHPSELAEEYIWDKFARTYFDADFGRFRKEWMAVRQALGHRPLHEGAPEHRQFLETTRDQLEQLALRQVDVADELGTVRTRLAALPLPRQPQLLDEPEDGEERIDIGEEAPAAGATKPVAPVNRTTAAEATKAADATGRAGSGEARPPRLSPEEFRAQRAARPERGRRDGRGKGQPAQPTETEQFQAASFAEADEFAAMPLLAATPEGALTPVASATEATPGAPATPLAADETEAGRKKKRRSRGGAKRTARKHAQRLAGEPGLSEGQLIDSDAALEAAADALGAAASAGAPAERASDQPTSRVPREALDSRESRNDRRRDGGRGVARAPLFAAPAAPDVDAPDNHEAGTQVSATPLAAQAAGAGLPALVNTEGQGLGNDLGVPSSSARKSRNRKKKKGNRAAGASTMEEGAAVAAALPVQPLPRGAEVVVVDNAEAIDRNANRQGNNRRDGRNGRDNSRRQLVGPVAALPLGETGAVATIPVVFVSAGSEAGTPTVAAAGTTPTSPAAASGSAGSERLAPASASSAQKQSKRKSRAMVGGRTEKPAFDTPIIPVADPAAPLTQVAAGRLMGTSASLVEPTETVQAGKVTSSAGKPAVSKAKAGKVAPPVAASATTAVVPEAASAPTVTSASGAKPAALAPVATTTPAADKAKRQPVDNGTKAAKTKPGAVAKSTAGAAAAPKTASPAAPVTESLVAAATRAAAKPAGKASKAAKAAKGAAGHGGQQQPTAAGKPTPAAKAVARAVAQPAKAAPQPATPATKVAASPAKAAKPTGNPVVVSALTTKAKPVAKPAANAAAAKSAAIKSAARPAPAAPAQAVVKPNIAQASPAPAAKITSAAKGAAKKAAVVMAKAPATAQTLPAVKASSGSKPAKAPLAAAKPAAPAASKAPGKASAKAAPAALPAKPASKAKPAKK